MKTAFKTAGAPAAPSEYKSPKMRIIQTTPRSVLCSSPNGEITEMEIGGFDDCCGPCGNNTYFQ